MRLLFAATLFVVTLLAPLNPSSACTCNQAPEPAAALKAATVVFVGKVTAQERATWGVSVTFEVDRAWKGGATKTLTVFTGGGGGDCGFRFEIGKSYLVYAHLSNVNEGAKPILATSICTRTCHIDNAGNDLKTIGEGKKIADAK